MNKEFGTYYSAPMTIDGVAWPTVEHFYQAQKFPTNPEYQEKIRTTKNPSTAKTMGKTKEIPERPDWVKMQDTVMIRAQRIKFQNKALADKLLATGNALCATRLLRITIGESDDLERGRTSWDAF
jgi:ribA/ribD-fused uncharacterized protein